MHPTLNIALKAARKASNVIMRHYERRNDLLIQEKNLHDFVTNADVAAEQSLIESIHEHFPEDAILSEEAGLVGAEDAYRRWVIDPLDGTMNFIRGYPNFAISIGIEEKGRTAHALIFHPITQDVYTATRGKGAQCNGRRIRAGDRRQLDDCMVSFGLNKHVEDYAEYFPWLRHLFETTCSLRKIGSCALELAYVACGYTDIYWSNTTRPWDISAGQLLVQEAGGMVTNASGGPELTDETGIIACNAHLIRPLLKSMQI